jgi:hypothetical protein
MKKQELETLLKIALDQRKKAYALNLPLPFIREVNRQIRNFRLELVEAN